MAKSMEFIDTPFKVGSVKGIKSKAQNNALDSVGTGQIIWHLVKRHKFGLVSTYAIILTAVWLFPPLPHIIMALFGR
jgi:hypothetical protein